MKKGGEILSPLFFLTRIIYYDNIIIDYYFLEKNMKNKFFITLVLAITFVCLFALGVSAKELYLEEIPDDLKIDGDTVTHFLVIEGEEYYGGSAGVVNLFNMEKIAEDIAKLETEGGALNKLGYTSSDLGTRFLTKLIIPDTFGGAIVTNVNINNGGSFKNQKYFTSCGYLKYPSTTTTTSDANQRNGQIRCIDFGENSQLSVIPFYYMNSASRLIRLKNMPKNLTSIEEGAFQGCSRLQGDENHQLYIGANTIKFKAFDNALANVNSIVFGENVQAMESESFSNSNANPGVTYIEFKCDVTKVAFPENSTTAAHTGAFYFGTSSNQRQAYSNLKCIILSNPAQAGCDGQTFRSVSGQDVFFNDTTGEDDFAYTSHAMQSINGCQESCSRCALTQLKKDADHTCVYSYTKADGSALSYLEEIYVNFECTICGTKSHLEKIDAIFINLGYSVEENVSEGAVTHKVKINKDALNRYEELTGKSLNYGVVAGIANDDLNGNIITHNGEKLVANGSTVMAEFSNTKYTIIELKLTKINKEISVYCNAYVADGANITYMCGDNESTKAVAQAIKLSTN